MLVGCGCPPFGETDILELVRVSCDGLSAHISIPESIRAHIRTLGGTSIDLAKAFAFAGRTASIPQPLSFSRPDYDATPSPRNDPRCGCVLAGSKGLCSNADDSRLHSQPKQDDLIDRDHRRNSPRSMLLSGMGVSLSA